MTGLKATLAQEMTAATLMAVTISPDRCIMATTMCTDRNGTAMWLRQFVRTVPISVQCHA